jgi:hypothetical protein
MCTGKARRKIACADAITRDPAALHNSFEFYRALETTMEQNVERQRSRITLPILAIGGSRGLGEGVGTTMRLAGADVMTLIIENAGHSTQPRKIPKR